MRGATGEKLCVYKFGITADPIVRRPYYTADNYTIFVLLHISMVLESVAWGEAFLIYDFKRMAIGACRNVRSGGDGSLSLDSGPFFLYMAAGRADSGKAIR